MPDSGIADGTVYTSAFHDTYVRQQVAAQVTSGTKPTGVEGRIIAVTDQDRLEAYDGAAWTRLTGWSAAGRTGLIIRRSAAQAIVTATDTAISWDIEDTDTDAFITVTSDTVTIPTALDGIYAITAFVAWASSPGANSNVRIAIAGTTGDYRTSVGTSTVAYQSQSVSAVTALAATNTIKIQCYQATGASINVTARLEVWRLAR